jgi:diadenosine tetraphosphate (Ap4A) HIT family hydrolase
MYDPDCVFCHRREQPPALIESTFFHVMPDKFPLMPGHTLIVTQEHRRCHALGTPESWIDLEEQTDLVRRFLEDSYRLPVLIAENGIAGQSVFHAHLHLIPLRLEGLPVGLVEHEDAIPVEGWSTVASQLSNHGPYRYFELGGQRYVFPGESPALVHLWEALTVATGLDRNELGWVKTTTPEDVADTGRRWLEWSQRRRNADIDVQDDGSEKARNRTQ